MVRGIKNKLSQISDEKMNTRERHIGGTWYENIATSNCKLKMITAERAIGCT
jgi:hypothetical protein